MDYPALALKLGMKNPRSAANAWGSIRKKIETGGGESAHGGVKASWKMSVKEVKDGQQLRMQSAGPPMSTTAQPFSFKVVKRESESRVDEIGFMGRDFGKLNTDLVPMRCQLMKYTAIGRFT